MLPPFPLKRFFIHRQGYFIVQDNADQMQDFKRAVKTESNMLELTDYQLNTIQLPYHFYAQDSLLDLEYGFQGEMYRIKGKILNWRELPALK